MYQMKCSEIWGGIRNEDQDVCSSGLTASLYSSACDGGKGGDIYYLSVCGSDMLTRVALADVVGHGSAVTAVSQFMYEALQAHMNDASGDRVLTQMNQAASGRGLEAMTTAAVVAFYLADNQLRFAYAGHHPALVRRRVDGAWIEASIREDDEGDADGPLADLPLAVADDTRYRQHETPLDTGDRIVLYTDGVIEAPARNREQFGIERLRAVLEDVGDAPLHELKKRTLDAVRDHTGGPLTHDDVTLLTLEVR